MAYTTIDDPSAFFQTKLYTGTGSSLALTNDGNSDLQPDWVWAKRRDGTYSHAWFDSSRGSTKRIISNLANTEDTNAQYITSFDSDGFTAGTDANINQSSLTYVAWQWKANGGTTSSNGDGNITSTVQANTTAGFSIVLFTGNATAGQTVGHGLGVKPEIIFAKNRSNGNNWNVYAEPVDNTGNNYLSLNGTVGKESDFNMWNDTAPTSSVITLGDRNETNGSSHNMVFYCFHSVKGYSKIGSYTGNGNADGTFVYTGFKPAWIMLKRTDSSNNWNIFDSKRDVDNQVGNVLYANLTSAEEADASHSSANDFLSNGFKLKETGNAVNGSGATYIYMAFAEHPFVSSEGVPVTAR